MALWEAKVLEGTTILGHAVGDVSKDGDVAVLVKQATDDFRKKNPTRSLLTEENTGQQVLSVSVKPLSPSPSNASSASVT